MGIITKILVWQEKACMEATEVLDGNGAELLTKGMSWDEIVITNNPICNTTTKKHLVKFLHQCIGGTGVILSSSTKYKYKM